VVPNRGGPIMALGTKKTTATVSEAQALRNRDQSARSTANAALDTFREAYDGLTAAADRAEVVSYEAAEKAREFAAIEREAFDTAQVFRAQAVKIADVFGFDEVPF